MQDCVCGCKSNPKCRPLHACTMGNVNSLVIRLPLKHTTVNFSKTQHSSISVHYREVISFISHLIWECRILSRQEFAGKPKVSHAQQTTLLWILSNSSATPMNFKGWKRTSNTSLCHGVFSFLRAIYKARLSNWGRGRKSESEGFPSCVSGGRQEAT